jgi:hypothetical protein
MNFAELKEIAKAVLDSKSRSFVEDAKTLATAFVKFDYEAMFFDQREMFANLTATQKRCSELIQAARVAAIPRDNRQTRIFEWAQSTFGDAAMTRRERMLRFIEEAIELAQTEDLHSEDVRMVLAHVYSKPKGEPSQEVGGVGVTLLAYCAVAGLSADLAETAEIGRVLAMDKEHFRKRHNAKADAGIATRVEE